MNLTDLSTFVLVAEAGTISGAAQRLGVPKSTVSRRVSRLEDALGVELLRRSARAVALTDHGRALHRRTSPALRELQDAGEALLDTTATPAGRLRLTTAVDFGQTRRFADMVASYGIRYPEVVVEVELTNRVVDLVEEGIDVGVRMHAQQLPGGAALMSRTLRRFQAGLYAGPSYLEERGRPRLPEELEGHRVAAHPLFLGRPFGPWMRAGEPAADVHIPAPRWVVNDFGALRGLAEAGAGLILMSTLLAEPRVASGDLVRVLPEYSVPGGAATAVWPASRHMAPRVRAFIDHAVATLGEG